MIEKNTKVLTKKQNCQIFCFHKNIKCLYFFKQFFLHSLSLYNIRGFSAHFLMEHSVIVDVCENVM